MGKRKMKEQHKRMAILGYRVIFCLLAWAALIVHFIQPAIAGPTAWAGFVAGISIFKYYTLQTNLFAAIWLTLAIIFHSKEERLAQIKGAVKGGITIYILVTFIVFAIMLSNAYTPTEPLSQFTNITTHYIVPLAFLADWFLTEHTKQYQWIYLAYWLVYPLLYLVFLVSHGLLTQDYLYYFLDINELGVGWFFITVAVLLVIYLVFGIVFVFGNRLLNKKLHAIKSEEEERERPEKTEK